MHKGRSASFQRRYKVHEIDSAPTSRNVEDDFIPTAANMSKEQATAERTQLLLENVRMEQEHSVAKRSGNIRDSVSLGLRIVTICDRLSLVNARIKQINMDESRVRFSAAVRDVVSPEVWDQIIQRERELRSDPLLMDALS